MRSLHALKNVEIEFQTNNPYKILIKTENKISYAKKFYI